MKFVDCSKQAESHRGQSVVLQKNGKWTGKDHKR